MANSNIGLFRALFYPMLFIYPLILIAAIIPSEGFLENPLGIETRYGNNVWILIDQVM
jgi:hypothetical protein